jgi:ribosomal protein S18 acetylase RimI-like enzyme
VKQKDSFVQVKKADVNDLWLLCSICRLSYSENFAGHWNEGGLSWYLENVYGLEAMRSDLVNPDINYFVAYVDHEPAGFMKLKLHSSLGKQSERSDLEIEKLYFRLPFQGKGIGRKLMSMALEIARTLDKTIVWLGVIDTNDRAIEFYKQMGFTFYDKVKLDVPYFKDELRGMWRMTLQL